MTLWLDLYRYRDLFLNLFRRELRAKYKGSALGIAWSLVYPLALAGVYTLVFSVILPTSTEPHYPLFLLSGLLSWVFFQTSLQSSCTALLGHANLVKQVRFPRQLLPLSVVATNFVTFGVMLAIVLPINLGVIPETRSTFWAVFPLAVLLIAFTSGLSVVVACINVLFRDVEHLVTTILLPWFFLTPIFYTFDSVSVIERHHTLAQVLTYVNPVTPILVSIRDVLYFGSYPSWIDVTYSVIAAAISLCLAAVVFRRVDDRLAVAL